MPSVSARSVRFDPSWWSGIALTFVILATGCTKPRGETDVNGRSVPKSAADASEDSSAAEGGTTDVFVDVAQAAGIDFVHFNGMSGEYYICEVKCAGGGRGWNLPPPAGPPPPQAGVSCPLVKKWCKRESICHPP